MYFCQKLHIPQILGVCLGLILSPIFLLPPSAVAAPPVWETLPPTPQLPAPERQGRAPVDGIRLWYGEYGLKNKGMPVVLLHGGFANSAYYGHLIPFLVGQGYHVIAIDSRGHGRSTRSDAPYSYHLMARDVVALLDRLHIAKADIVGWSDGGIIGLDMAITMPKRINRLFAFGTNANLAGVRADCAKTPTFAAYLTRTETEYEKISPTPGQFGAFEAAMVKMWSTEPDYSAAQLKSIQAPVTIADGQYDECILMSHDAYLFETIPHANIVILPNVSHFAMVQQPQEFDAAVLQFLKWR